MKGLTSDMIQKTAAANGVLNISKNYFLKVSLILIVNS
jgi:hypothetical protein